MIQPFLLCYVNNVVLMLTSIFLSIISLRKGRRFVSKQGQPQPHIHSKARITVKWSILDLFGCLPASPSLGIIPFMCCIANSDD